MPDLIIPILFLMDGLILIALSVFAHEIGLDPTAGWGGSRFALLLLGTGLAAVFPLWAIFKDKRAEAFVSFRSKRLKTWFLLGHLWGFIFLVYIWFITYSNFTTWDHTTHYYTQLADGFSKGQLYVDQKPDKALLDAPDPYDHTSRPPFSDEIWDLSLYNGKLYLYWGPLPALLITPVQMAFEKKITDNYLVFFFFAGLLIVNSLIILKLKSSFFPKAPAWSMFVSIVLIGLILPVSWSLNVPNVYAAAIGAGQFFLMGGIYFLLLAIEPDSFPHKKSLFFAGVFWACAVGSRAIIVLSVIFLAAFMSVWIAKMMPRPIRWKQYVQAMSALYFPLIFGAILIGWYNWARFDSPSEFGLRYMISIFNLNKDISLTFRPDYFLLNLYIYIFQPFEFASGFPFIRPIMTLQLFEQQGIDLPYLYLSGRVTGFLFGMPFLILGLANLFFKEERTQQKTFLEDSSRRSFILTLLAGSLLINFLAILFYFFGQIRFLVDIISQTTLLAIVGYWRILSFRQDTHSAWLKLLVLVANSLVILTLCTSLLLALTSETSRMETLNPDLFDKINGALSISR